MDTISYKTISANKNTVSKDWILVDASEKTLGRLSSTIALVLRGKHKTNFTPHVDCGDNIIVINAEKIQLTGNKWDTKEYIRHTGYSGGQRSETANELLKKDPRRLIEKAVKGMLPKNRLGRSIYSNLHVYVGQDHPHEAQKPKTLDLNKVR